eukprot:gnl/Chilomastix_cuspidata/2210.p1 GENE.gnl/Chilomastix_cuspidata/2210~~gnl/Chilomastix_cuspidata/2210.p1  ORF type:complete len:121 (+),score=12.05 gnl/Chilomastix_cuspidata/2210:42-365(+)
MNWLYFTRAIGVFLLAVGAGMFGYGLRNFAFMIGGLIFVLFGVLVFIFSKKIVAFYSNDHSSSVNPAGEDAQITRDSSSEESEAAQPGSVSVNPYQNPYELPPQLNY